MTRFVIDPPTLIQLAGSGQELDTTHQLVAPNSVRSQALDLLLADVRHGGLSEGAALDLHERMTELKIRLLGDRVSRRTAWQIARQHDWDSIRHAEYLAITQLQADALIASDPELAGKAAGVVPLAQIGALGSP